jgi:hypothetical protein
LERRRFLPTCANKASPHAVEILVLHKLVIWNAVIYCTLVERDILMVGLR